MANTRRIGNESELRLEKALVAAGYLVHRARQTGRQTPNAKEGRCDSCGGWKSTFYTSQTNDIFELFDLIAVAPGEPTLWLQVTTGGGNAAVRRRKIEEKAECFRPRRGPIDGVTGEECISENGFGHHTIQVWTWNRGRPTERSTVRQKWKVHELIFTETGFIWSESLVTKSDVVDRLVERHPNQEALI